MNHLFCVLVEHVSIGQNVQCLPRTLLMFHGTNTQRLLLFRNKRRLEKEQQVHTYSCVNTSSHKSVFPPYQLWLCSGSGRCQRFLQNNVTRRGIPVRPSKREEGGGGVCARRGGGVRGEGRGGGGV